MLKDKKFLGIIPARKGSKRLPKKNILDLGGKPLIQWTIEEGLKSKFLDNIVISSNDKEVLKIGRESNINTIKRPKNISLDDSTSIELVEHALKKVSEKYDYIVFLQPTSPLRTSLHIDEAIELLIQKNADAIISTCKMEHSPLWSNTLPKDKSMKNFINSSIKNKRSQELPTYYRINGAIYIIKISRLLKEKTFMLSSNIYSYIMPRNASYDIDTIDDFNFVEYLIKEKKNA